jgi:hypothetical protein
MGEFVLLNIRVNLYCKGCKDGGKMSYDYVRMCRLRKRSWYLLRDTEVKHQVGSCLNFIYLFKDDTVISSAMNILIQTLTNKRKKVMLITK